MGLLIIYSPHLDWVSWQYSNHKAVSLSFRWTFPLFLHQTEFLLTLSFFHTDLCSGWHLHLEIHQWAWLITELCLSIVLFPSLATCLAFQWALLVAVTQMNTQHNVVLKSFITCECNTLQCLLWLMVKATVVWAKLVVSTHVLWPFCRVRSCWAARCAFSIFFSNFRGGEPYRTPCLHHSCSFPAAYFEKYEVDGVVK